MVSPYTSKNPKGEDVCYITARFTKKAIDFLSKASRLGHSQDEDGSHSQKELTGELFVKEKEPSSTYVIDLNEHSIEHGMSEDVDVQPFRFNFHSHPYEAYVRHGVDKAWPSSTDFLGLRKLGNHTVFHCLATEEGMYIMSLGPYWCNRIGKTSEKFIEDKYDIDHKESYTPEEYVKIVNAIKYKGQPIFEVQYFPWNKAHHSFKVHFAKSGGKCVI